VGSGGEGGGGMAGRHSKKRSLHSVRLCTACESGCRRTSGRYVEWRIRGGAGDF